MIKMGKLHPDIVKGIVKPTIKMWKLMMINAPAMYLVKNLASFRDHLSAYGVQNILKDHKLLSVERLQKGRVLPFRMMQAWSMIRKDKHPNDQNLAQYLAVTLANSTLINELYASLVRFFSAIIFLLLIAS